MGGGPGPGGANHFQNYQFHGDPFATFSSFFGDEDPFKDLFRDNGGFGGFGPVSLYCLLLFIVFTVCVNFLHNFQD